MAGEMEQTPTDVPADTASQTTPAGGETQQANAPASTGTSEAGQAEHTQEVADIQEWNGSDVENLPKPLQARARGMLRYFHKVTQDAAEAKRKAEMYDRLQLQGTQQPLATQPIATPESLPVGLTQDDAASLQSGDPAALQNVIMKLGQPLVQQINQLQQQLQIQNVEREIEAFASARPDFWEVPPEVMKASLQEVMKTGGSIADAYNKSIQIVNAIAEKTKSKLDAKVQEKKKAVTASPSRSMEPTVIEVDNRRDAERVAAQAAWDGKKVEVRVRKKGKN